MRHEVTAGAEARWLSRRTRRRASGVARPLVGQRSRADITRCPPGAACGTAGRMRVLDVVTDPDNPPRLPYAPRRPTAACGGGSTRRDELRGRMRSYVLRTAHKQTNGRKRFLRTRLVSRCPPGPAQPTLHEPLGPHPQRPAPCAPRPRRADRADLGLYVHLHCLVTDGAFEERGAEAHFPPAPAPTPERMTAVLAQVHKATAAVAQDDDLDSTLRWPPACSSGSPARIWRRPSRQQGLR